MFFIVPQPCTLLNPRSLWTVYERRRAGSHPKYAKNNHYVVRASAGPRPRFWIWCDVTGMERFKYPRYPWCLGLGLPFL